MNSSADEEKRAEALRTIFDELVLPLLKADGANGEVLGFDEDKLVVRVSGSAAYGVGSHYVRTNVIVRALHEVEPGLEVQFEKTAELPVKLPAKAP
ncbi:MAG: Fe-S cluster biogenesis protein NfuA [Polyangiales bacterium]